MLVKFYLLDTISYCLKSIYVLGNLPILRNRFLTIFYHLPSFLIIHSTKLYSIMFWYSFFWCSPPHKLITQYGFIPLHYCTKKIINISKHTSLRNVCMYIYCYNKLITILYQYFLNIVNRSMHLFIVTAVIVKCLYKKLS